MHPLASSITYLGLSAIYIIFYWLSIFDRDRYLALIMGAVAFVLFYFSIKAFWEWE